MESIPLLKGYALCTDFTLQAVNTWRVLGHLRNLWRYLHFCKTYSNQTLQDGVREQVNQEEGIKVSLWIF